LTVSKCVKALMWTACLVLVVVFGAQHLGARILLNYGQLARLHGVNQPWIYSQALALTSNDEHIRWQYGAALAAADDTESAVSILRPLAQSSPHQLVMNLLFLAFIDTGRVDEALRLYLSSASFLTPDYLPSRVAANLLVRYLDDHSVLPASAVDPLLARALELRSSSPDYALLTEQLESSTEWSNGTGQRLHRTLQWLARGTMGKLAKRSAEVHESEDLAKRVAMLLDLPSESVKLGKELTTNGDFESLLEYLPQSFSSPRLEGWSASFMTGNGPWWNRAVFVVGVDTVQPYQGSNALRVDGLSVERLPEREPARAGAWHEPVTVTAESPYVVSFAYRTEMSDEGEVGVFLSYDSEVFGPLEQKFGPTHGEWKSVIILARNKRDRDEMIEPLLRSWSEGSVWFDSFSVREVLLSSSLPAADGLVDVQ
jgi:hypothetical protein